ncbi:unnamed protein product [Sympodiomycopsis kandeliae]
MRSRSHDGTHPGRVPALFDSLFQFVFLKSLLTHLLIFLVPQTAMASNHDASTSTAGGWTPSSWRTKPISQDVRYPDAEHLSSVLTRLRSLPGLVTPDSIDQLSNRMQDVANGKAFLLQAGDCAELFQDCTPEKIQAKLRLVLMMSLVIIWGARVPVVRVGRIAGQYGKPRSKDTEIVDLNGVPTEVLSYRGDNVNGFDKTNRSPDPERLLQAYFHSTATINHIRGLLESGFADLHTPLSFTFDHVRDQSLQESYKEISNSILDSLDFMKTVGADPSSSNGGDSSLNRVDYFTSHEGLMLEYEEALTRCGTAGGEYNLSTHLLWLGDRTRDLDGAHIEYFRGIRNPIGIKVGPSMKPEELVRLLDIVNPNCIKGRVTLIGRFGASKITDCLPNLIKAVQASKHSDNIIWISDPMHGNTISLPSHPQIKTRLFTSIISELTSSFSIHSQCNSTLNGVHLELTGEVDENDESVTECVGGSMQLSENELQKRYKTHCDPRLNVEQSLDVAFLISSKLKEQRLACRQKQ